MFRPTYFIFWFWIYFKKILEYFSYIAWDPWACEPPPAGSAVIEFGANREPVYDFLLVINSNLDPVSHRYWDTAKIFSYVSLRAFVRGNPPLNLWKSFTVPETRVFQAADGEDLAILACTVFDWSTRVTDRRTDGRTDRIDKIRWETEWSFDCKLYQEYSNRKLSKSDNWYPSYSQKCWFFLGGGKEDTVFCYC